MVAWVPSIGTQVLDCPSWTSVKTRFAEKQILDVSSGQPIPVCPLRRFGTFADIAPYNFFPVSKVESEDKIRKGRKAKSHGQADAMRLPAPLCARWKIPTERCRDGQDVHVESDKVDWRQIKYFKKILKLKCLRNSLV